MPRYDKTSQSKYIGLGMIFGVAIGSALGIAAGNLALGVGLGALKEIEAAFPESHRLFAIDAAAQGTIVRYTFAIRILLGAQLLFGLGVAWLGVYRL